MGIVIRDLPILDLRAISIAAIAKIERVENIRTVVLNPENAEAFMEIPRVNVRSHLIVRQEEDLRIAQIEFDDEFLGKLADDTKLVVLGHLFVDGFTIPLFFRKVRALRMFGQVLYSDSRSAGALLSRMERLQGQLLQMPSQSIRWIGSTYVDKAALAALSGHSIASIGQVTIAPGITASDIMNNIESMTQIGEIRGKDEVICAMLAVCNRRLGTYTLA
ncbi:MAG TPA: hypothetical protein VKY85_12120 [Candidatus Angelobacter sp.]|nr:hypothetical protein [Candidatus Angelobacter sp.]